MRLHELLEKMKPGEVACKDGARSDQKFKRNGDYGYCSHAEDYRKPFVFTVYDILKADNFKIIKPKEEENQERKLAEFILKTIEDGIRSGQVKTESHFKNRIKELRFCLNHGMEGIEKIIIDQIRDSICDVFDEAIKLFRNRG